MNRQEFYRARYRSINPHWQDSVTLYRKAIEALVGPETALLDIGCGHGDILQTSYNHAALAVGLEPDLAALQRNTVLHHTVQGIGETLPFADQSFDLVTAAWVFEHVEEPLLFLREIWRVLRVGGRVVFLTPNVWNYNVWMIRAVPNRWHSFFTTRLYDRQDDDTYPVRYRINSFRRVEQTFIDAGFQREVLRFNGDPSYISFNNPLFDVARFIEHLLDQPALQAARVHLIGTYVKV